MMSGVLRMVPVLTFSMVCWLGCSGTRPEYLGSVGGRLYPCPKEPDCVSSYASANLAVVEPITYSGTVGDAMQRLRKVVDGLPRTKIIKATDTYLYAEYACSLFGLVSDLEFLFDPMRPVIHVRSVSRVNIRDRSSNRELIEKVRKRFAEAKTAEE